MNKEKEAEIEKVLDLLRIAECARGLRLRQTAEFLIDHTVGTAQRFEVMVESPNPLRPKVKRVSIRPKIYKEEKNEQ